MSKYEIVNQTKGEDGKLTPSKLVYSDKEFVLDNDKLTDEDGADLVKRGSSFIREKAVPAKPVKSE